VGGAKQKIETVPLAPSIRAWTPAQRAVIDLHFYYLTNVWSLNDWKVYSRYKKHLPRESRFEVDQLVDLMMKDLPREMRAKLDAIFAVIWDAEDWLAVIASDELAHDLEPADQQAWRDKVAATQPK
jgi:hypothetical protein